MVRLPFSPGRFRMTMALSARWSDDLVEIDDRYPDEMAERRGLLATRRSEVFAAEPGTEVARAEVLSVLADLLPRRYPDWFVRDRGRLRNRLTGEDWELEAPRFDPLEVAGRLVAEDLCLIDSEAEEGPTLRAALLCAPSGWLLGEKIGRPLAAVHGSVPLYAERLSGAVDRLMRSLRPGRLVERLNWGLSGDAALFQPVRIDLGTVSTADVGRRLFLRVERQTLTRLPGSRMVLFAIRVHSTALERIAAIPGAARDLAAAVQGLPDPICQYKGLGTVRTSLMAYLQDRF